MKKIFFIGNQNNNHFAFARHLRDAGFKSHVWLFDNEQVHFSPNSDSDMRDAQEMTSTLTWGSRSSFLFTKKNKIQHLFDTCELICGCGSTPAFAQKAGRELDVLIPYGNDVRDEASFRKCINLRAPHELITVFFQKTGLKKIKLVHSSLSNAWEEGILRARCPNAKFFTGVLPMVYEPSISKIDSIKLPESLEKVINNEAREKFLVLAHGRHHWGEAVDNLDPNLSKGNDKLIKGWSIFIKNFKMKNAHLILVEYGPNVDESKNLIRDLGIEDSIIWLPVMPRKQIFKLLSTVDLVAGEFNLNWLVYGVILEALSMKKPVLTYRNDNFFKINGRTIFPIYNAREPEEIAEKLQLSFFNRGRAREIGITGYEWYKAEVEKSVSFYANLLE